MAESSGASLLTLIQAAPSYFGKLYSTKAEWFLPVLKCTSIILRENIANIISILLVENISDNILKFLNVLISGLKEREGLAIGLDGVHGYLLSLGGALASCRDKLTAEYILEPINLIINHFDHRVVLIRAAAAEGETP